ncbi:MAG: hypothetical protein L6R41_000273 [Letrouitia leprolyta]|nr:MAG: hypothetical protein L6R41_000273 [Letrouitia leprolyta]
MTHQNRLTNSSIRHPSLGGSQPSTGQSPMLLARINEKKAELENLKQLRDLSVGLTAQMQTLEQKLSTLSDGTEAIAAVLSNWHTVLQAINMASAKIPQPKVADGGDITATSSNTQLPQSLVRIPVQEEPSQPSSQDCPERE